jgi:hypothetical protein
MATTVGTPIPSRLPVVLTVIGLALLPWTAIVGWTLPSEHVARHWDIAWAGFDVALSVSLLATAYAAARGCSWLSQAAAVAGTLLLCDAWFDVLTASGGGLWRALVLAAVAEMPLAVLCFVISARMARSLGAR